MASHPAKRAIILQYGLSSLCMLGIFVSLYGLIVEVHLDHNPEYKPMCDLSETVSCTKALGSKYGTGLGLVAEILGEDHWLNQKNPVFGIIAYILLFCIGLPNSLILSTIHLSMVLALNVLTLYLGFILYHLGAVCLVCITIYVINLIMLPLSVWRRNAFREIRRKKRV